MMRLLFVALFILVGVGAQEEVEFTLNSVGTPDGFDVHILQDALSVEDVEVVFQQDCDPPNFWNGNYTTFWAYGGCIVTLKVKYLPLSNIHHTVGVYGRTQTAEIVRVRVEDRKVGQIAGLEVLHQISHNRCIYKINFWYHGYYIFTSHRCRARFRIWYMIRPPPLCFIKHFPKPVTHYQIADGEFITDVAHLRLSDRCIFFRYNRRLIILRGCAGYFLICKYRHWYNCHGVMDPHFLSLDAAKLSIRPACWYLASCTLPYIRNKCIYRIAVKTEYKPHTEGTWIAALKIKVPFAEIFLDKEVKVNDQVIDINHANSPYIIHKAGVCIYWHRLYIRIVLRCGIIIKWDYLQRRFYLTLPWTYVTQVYGICGNANCIRHDDLLTADGQHLSEFQSRKKGFLEIAKQFVIDDPSNEAQCAA